MENSPNDQPFSGLSSWPKKMGRKSFRLNLFLRFDLSFLLLDIIVLEHWHNLAESEVIKYSEISVYKTKKIK